LFKHQPVAFLQAFERQRQPAQLVFAIRVRAANVENQVRRHFFERMQQSLFQGVQIFVVARAVREADILIVEGGFGIG
jgi:hypothetical protein